MDIKIIVGAKILIDEDGVVKSWRNKYKRIVTRWQAQKILQTLLPEDIIVAFDNELEQQ